MAHYALLENDVVVEVIVGNDENEGVDWESYYACVTGKKCRRTSYNTQCGLRPDGSPGYRGNYAGLGYLWLEEQQIFVPPCPGEGWTLNEATATWVEPQ